MKLQLPIVGLRRLLGPWSKIACSVSNASFLVFHASLFASARIVVPFSRLSISTLGNKSSNASADGAPPLEPPPEVAVAATSLQVRVGTGAGVPSTLSNSPRIVLRSCGFKPSSRSLIPTATVNQSCKTMKQTALTGSREELDRHERLCCTRPDGCV